jgi:DNA-binding NtrC family response regulator
MSALPNFSILDRAMPPASTSTHFTGRALIASPSQALRERVAQNLSGRWHSVTHAVSGADALGKLESGEWQTLFLDRALPDLDSAELIAMVARRFPRVQTVYIDTASAAARRAADMGEDAKSHERGEAEAPADPLENPLAGDVQAPENREGHRYPALPGMIGRSAAIQSVYRLAHLVAPRSTTVLIVGPTGSGKELVARALHQLSPRAAKAFVAVNCAAIPEALLESELFGYARGAFTGAVQAQVGRIPAAHGGTLFLDEVSELPLGMQAKLLRFLEQKEVQRLGSAELTRVDVRVVAASNVDLAGRAGRGEFREDLFYRLSAFPLELPPLSERRGDILPLAQHFLACMATAMGLPCLRLSAEAMRVLEDHPWRGNVRELQHVMERASILVETGDTVLREHIYFPFQSSPFQSSPPPLSTRPHSCAGRAS